MGNVTLDRVELESLWSVIDAAQAIRRRPQFYLWVQGVVQGLLPHEVLVCVAPRPDAQGFHCDRFAGVALDPAVSRHLDDPASGLLGSLAAAWEQSSRSPLVLDRAEARVRGWRQVAEEIQETGFSRVAVHGTWDFAGATVSLFALCGIPDEHCERYGGILEVLAPFLQIAWQRTMADEAGENIVHAVGPQLLTAREGEVLTWVQQGKSNLEIGNLLNISPLTVKNHIQKILRKLKVQNRTEAVARAISLRLVGRVSR